ncbi:uncharacterized protein LOC126092808 [Schistocerca cancellata]|uniref:uncharacterized protein LOC126092808 n=1 Tax=Schistocerca cancellata TaxID=274614 RepID=UPI0021185A10|nr:uncharacterized protein LOC126092808 [Schistocerca cancellata]
MPAIRPRSKSVNCMYGSRPRCRGMLPVLKTAMELRMPRLFECDGCNRLSFMSDTLCGSQARRSVSVAASVAGVSSLVGVVQQHHMVSYFIYSLISLASHTAVLIMSSTDSASEVDVSVLNPPKKRAKKKSLNSEKHMVLNVYKTELLHPEQSMSDIVSKTAAATGVGRSSVYRVITVTVVNEDADLANFRRTTFYKLLREMNFIYVRRARDSMLIDRDDIFLWRRRYLRTINQLRDEGRPIYYLDETWVNAGHTRSYVWVDDTINSSKRAFLSGLSTGSKGPSGKGKRLIIAHIGSNAGFVEGCLWTFESKKSGDYHEEMCAETFEKWFLDVLPRLQENAVIVLDNAPYNSRRKEKVPNANSNKHEIPEWLKSKNIHFEDGMLKKELLDIVKNHRTAHNEYAIDEMANKAGKTVLIIPPYHCELNTIELVWARIKGCVAVKNKT